MEILLNNDGVITLPGMSLYHYGMLHARINLSMNNLTLVAKSVVSMRSYILPLTCNPMFYPTEVESPLSNNISYTGEHIRPIHEDWL